MDGGGRRQKVEDIIYEISTHKMGEMSKKTETRRETREDRR